MRDVLELIPESERSNFSQAIEKQDEIDAHQLLSDFGYLKRSAYDDGIITNDEYHIAVKEFRRECKITLEDEGSTNFKELWDEALITEEDTYSDGLSQTEILLLKTLSGLEGELIFRKFPEKLEVCCRVAYYRFRVYSLIHSNVTPKQHLFNQHLSKFEEVLKQYKAGNNLSEFLNILGDQKRLSDFCKNSKFSQEGFIGPIFFFKVKKKARTLNKLTGEKIKLTKRKDFLPNIRVAKLRNALAPVLKNSPVDQVNNYIASRENQFMLRVLQVKLWVMGLYQGKLDHDFGPLSMDALKQFLRLIYKENDGGEDDLKNILYIINNQQCVINFQYLLEEHIMKIESSEEGQNVLEDYFPIIEGDFQNHENEEVREKASELNREIERSMIDHTQKLIGLKEPKRLYKGKDGFRKFIAKMVSFVKNTFQKLVALIKKLIDIVKKSIKFIFEGVKEAFLTFSRGISFLFGKRRIDTNDRVYSDYDFDFDGFTYLKSSAQPNDINQHVNAINLRAESLYPAIRFATEVIVWGLKLATGIGWVQVLIGISRLLKQFLMKK